jgi:uncharacterized protein YciI
MSHFAVVAWDVVDSAAIRIEARHAHFAHIETIIDKVAVAGPMKDEDGAIIGSLVVLDVSDAAEAETVLRSDPYFKAGVWDRWTIHPFLAAAGEWVGGKIW